MAKRNNIESELCKMFMLVVREMQRLKVFKKPFYIYHVANEGERTKWAGMHMKELGLMAGVFDYCIILPGGKTAYIEFKKDSKTNLRPTQKTFASWLDHLGVPWLKTHCPNQAVNFIGNLLNNC